MNQAVTDTTDPAAALARLGRVSQRLRVECPWDAEQTHRSLVTHLVEETAEVVDAIEEGSATDLRVELGDLLLQIYFHSVIADEAGEFTLADVADGIADKLIRRHPHVFGEEETPDDLGATWEARKMVEKGRRSALDGIAVSLDPLARAAKVAGRTRNHRIDLPLDDRPITADQVGEQILALVERAHASGVDAAQATRDAVRQREAQVHQLEAQAQDATASGS